MSTYVDKNKTRQRKLTFLKGAWHLMG